MTLFYNPVNLLYRCTALRNILIRSSASHSIQYSSFSGPPDVTTIAPRPRSDPIILALRSARSTNDALKVIGIHAPHMEQEHVILSLRTLSSLNKTDLGGIPKSNLINSDEFQVLCRRLKKHLPTLEVSDVIDAFKTVTFFKVPHNSVITMKLLQLIKNDINSLNINQIMFLAFLLHHYSKVRNPLIEALRIALPVVFEAQLQTKLDRSNVSTLSDALTFCTHNFLAISRQSKDYIVDALCGLDQLDWVTMDPKKARIICVAISDLAIDAPAYETVFRDAIEIVTQNISSYRFNELEILINAILRHTKTAQYLANIPFFEALAETAVRNDYNVVECGVVLRKLNYLTLVNRNILNHMADKIMEEPQMFKEGKFGLVKTFVGGLSIANYKTDHWNLLKDLLPACRCMVNVSINEPWISMALELASLDIFSDPLLSTIFSDAFLEKHLSREYNKLDLLKLLRLYQAVSVLHPNYSGPMPNSNYLREARALNAVNITDLPLRGALHNQFGAHSVLSRCKTDLGIYIDHVIAVGPSGEALAFAEETNSEDFVYIDRLNMPPNCTKIAVNLLSPINYNSLNQLRGHTALSTRVLERCGYAVVDISQQTWSDTPDWEKLPYLSQQINIKSSRQDFTISGTN